MSEPGSPELASLIADEIDRSGPMPFSRFVDLALYEPDRGFYAVQGRAGGRQGDFVTSVETGPLFGALVGEWLDRTWGRLGRPDPFLVTEAAAGVGTLWRTVRRASPECFAALHWTLAERSATLRAAHGDLPDGAWISAAELPATAQHVIVANELLDNLAFDVIVRRGGAWRHLLVDRSDEGFAFEAGPAHDPGLTGAFAEGDRVPLAVGALDWLERARKIAEIVLVFDYGADSSELASRGLQGWLRTYAGHRRGTDPFTEPGSVDITHDVPFDQLPTPRHRAIQADWLREHGIDERVAEARATWDSRAHIGDLEAMFARSAIGEAEALTDPTGLGAFSVLEW